MSTHYDSIFNRHSVRDFNGSLSLRQKEELQDFADQRYSLGMDEYGVRIVVAASDKVFQRHGKDSITGTNTFAAIISKKADDLFIGYFGESFVLECVRRGFGTCWLGLGFKKKAAQALLELDRGEEVSCIIALGIPGDEIKATQRKSIKALTSYNEKDFSMLPRWQRLAVEAARLSPSTLNIQPWEFEIYTNAIAIRNTRRSYGYEFIDCGVAMLHLELAARFAGKTVHWDIDKEKEFILVADEAVEDNEPVPDYSAYDDSDDEYTSVVVDDAEIAEYASYDMRDTAFYDD